MNREWDDVGTDADKRHRTKHYNTSKRAIIPVSKRDLRHLSDKVNHAENDSSDTYKVYQSRLTLMNSGRL
jgi:hypothetical protein